MRTLVVTRGPNAHAALDRWALGTANAVRFAPALYSLPALRDDEAHRAALAPALLDALHVLHRNTTLTSLLDACSLTHASLPHTWRAAYACHARSSRLAHVDDSSAATSDSGATSELTPADFLCALAQALPGRAALTTAISTDCELMLLRTSRMWFLCRRSAAWTRRLRRLRSLERSWAARPYTFSAALNFGVAQLTVAIALAHHRHRHPAFAGGLLDPCCGSGTLLVAARAAGLVAVGCDRSRAAVSGTTHNLDHAAALLGASLRPSLILHHDCIADGSLPREATRDVGIVVANLPWDRQVRVPHARYLEQMIASLSSQLPRATFCFVSAAPLCERVLAAASLSVVRSERVASRCTVSVCVGAALGDGQPAAAVTAAVDDASREAVRNVLQGGGLRGRGPAPAPRLPEATEAIEIQCRLEAGGRAWVAATVTRTATANFALGQSDCVVRWDDSARDTAALPTALRLALHEGTNWRYAGGGAP